MAAPTYRPINLNTTLMSRSIVLPALLITSALTAQTNNALHFDAVDDRVDCGTDVSLDIMGTSITVEAWINPTAWGPNIFSGNIVNKEDAAWAGYMMRCGASGQLNFAIGNGVNWYETNSPANVLGLNTWQHVAATYDGAFVRLYVDGLEVTSMAYTIPIAHANNPLVLGDWSIGTNHRYFNGIMDEVRVWNITLSAATIAANYNTQFCAGQPGLVAYYKCDQGVAGADNTTITTLMDETGTNNGTLSGFELIGSTSNFVGGAPFGTPVNDVICPDESYLFNGQELTEPGVYTATFDVAGACDSIVILTLTETTVNVNVAQNANLLISQAGGAAFQWINCATNAPIVGANNQYYTAFTVGEYAVIVTQNGCSDTSACYNVTTIGMDEQTLPTARVWPSITSDMLNIEFAAPVQRAELSVVDMTGRTVIRRQVPSLLRTSLDVTDLVPGAYCLQVAANGATRTVRFVRE